MHAKVVRGNRYWLCGELLAARGELGATSDEIGEHMARARGRGRPTSIGELTAGVRQGLRRFAARGSDWEPLPCRLAGRTGGGDHVYRYTMSPDARIAWRALVARGGEKKHSPQRHRGTEKSRGMGYPKDAGSDTSVSQCLSGEKARPGQATLFGDVRPGHWQFK